MTIVGVAELKANLSAYLSLADLKKEEIEVQRRGKPIARIVPAVHKQKNANRKLDIDAIINSPSEIDDFVGVFKDEKFNETWQEEREDYLRTKYSI